MEIIIRKAVDSDLASIYELVLELAIYENGREQVTTTLEDYQNDFKEGLFESIVAESKGEIVGMMLYYMTFSTWKGKMLYLEDFVVKESFRSKGVGQKLYNAFLDIVKAKGARLAKWQVLDWNEPAIKFYEKNNAEFDKEWWNVKIYT